MFTNLVIDLNTLPEATPQTLTAVEGRYAWIGGALTLLWGLVISAFFLAWSHYGNAALDRALADSVHVWLPVTLVGFVLLSIGVIAKRKRVRYCLREHDMVLERGLFFRSQTIQPLRRLQHVAIHQGPLEKVANLSSLSVYSAGSGVATFRIPGLKQDMATQLRDQALAYQNRA